MALPSTIRAASNADQFSPVTPSTARNAIHGVSIEQMNRAIVGIMILMTVTCAAGQTVPNDARTPISICQALREVKKLNGRLVAIRGLFHFTRRHGGWILDSTARGEPCPNMPKHARIWQSSIWLESVKEANLRDGPVRFREDSPDYADLISESDRIAAEQVDIAVTLIGEIRTPKDLRIVPAPSGRGDTMGNGYGVGGAFPAALVVKTYRDLNATKR